MTDWQHVLKTYSFIFVTGLRLLPITIVFWWLGLLQFVWVISSVIFVMLGEYWVWKANKELNKFHNRIKNG